MLFKRRDLISNDCRRHLYHALVNSHVQYGIELYGNATNSALQPLNSAMNKVLRTLQNGSRYCSVKQLYVNYDVLPVNLLFKLNMAKMVFKSLNFSENLPTSMATKDIFCGNNISHSYNTRLSCTNYLSPEPSTAFFKSLAFLNVTEWNKIPISIRTATSLHSFINSYKQHLYDTW